jgi:NADPH-dependent 2,4-dienoyl-CoA reductase/sulfur reductase-like enzyme
MSETRWDVVVIGGGPAGLAAAARAAESGAKTMLIDDNPRLGGQIWRAGITTANGDFKTWEERVLQSGVNVLAGVQIVECPERGVLMGEDYKGLHAIRYSRLVLATGARELLLPFPGWTLPNVCGCGGLQSLVKSGLNVRGKRLAVAGTGPLLLAAAAYLRKCGGEIALIAEQASLARLAGFATRLFSSPAKLRQAFSFKGELEGVALRTSCWPVEARGDGQLSEVKFRSRRDQFTVSCDYLAYGFGLVPNLELPRLLGCDVREGFVVTDERQQTSVESVYCAGEPTGIGGVDAAICEGQIAGLAAAGRETEFKGFLRERLRGKKFEKLLRTAFVLRPELRGLCREDTLVCRCEDVTFGRVREMKSWREAKLQTRCGMGACQGRTCGASAEFLFGWNAVHTRPPVFPARVETLSADSMPPEG